MNSGPYSLRVISKEQQQIHSILSGLQNCLRNRSWDNPEGVDLGAFKKMFRKFVLLDHYCHTRKLEAYVIPALRKASTEVDVLLGELDSISSHSLHMLRYVYDQMESAVKDGMVSVKALFSALDVYCSDLHTRLAREENELFYIARHLLSPEEWHTIAQKCCSHLDNRNARKQAFFPLPSLAHY